MTPTPLSYDEAVLLLTREMMLNKDILEIKKWEQRAIELGFRFTRQRDWWHLWNAVLLRALNPALFSDMPGWFYSQFKSIYLKEGMLVDPIKRVDMLSDWSIADLKALQSSCKKIMKGAEKWAKEQGVQYASWYKEIKDWYDISTSVLERKQAEVIVKTRQFMREKS